MPAVRDGAYLLYDGLLYLAAVLAAPMVLLRAVASRDFRSALPGRLGWTRRLPGEGRLLLHGVSVGEVRAMRPLVEALRQRLPERELAVSSTTPGGRATARRLFPELPVVPFPLDLRGACGRFLDRVRPRAVILMELEIWPNFLRACSRRDIPVAIVNGRITERSMSGYLRVQRLLPQFDRIRLYGVQNERYADRFRALAVPAERIVLTGHLKYDARPVAASAKPPVAPWSLWVRERPAVVLGSTHSPEERQILAAAARAGDVLGQVLWLVVPRHPERGPRVARELAGLWPGAVHLRSCCPVDRPLPPGAVLVVDSFGELEQVYRAARVAFVGGSLLPHGGQNVLEPAALGRPVLVGPHTDNFAEEVALLEAAGGLRRARRVPELLELLAAWLKDPAAAAAAGAAGAAALAACRGATERTLAALEEAGLLP